MSVCNEYYKLKALICSMKVRVTRTLSKMCTQVPTRNEYISPPTMIASGLRSFQTDERYNEVIREGLRKVQVSNDSLSWREYALQ